MFERLLAAGFDIAFTSHAEAILGADFPELADSLEAVLGHVRVPIEEIIGGGGGEALVTQRMRRALVEAGWRKSIFTVQKRITFTAGREALEIPSESQSHEIDHVRQFANGNRIAMEIEWNNKDPFFDRDLENFKRLHADGAISAGIIITRGRSLHEAMHTMVRRFLDIQGIDDLGALKRFRITPTPWQQDAIRKRTQRKDNALSFRDALADQFVSDKFGEATTHWRKLEDRVLRGVGNPCPLLLIGLPEGIVRFD